MNRRRQLTKDIQAAAKAGKSISTAFRDSTALTTDYGVPGMKKGVSKAQAAPAKAVPAAAPAKTAAPVKAAASAKPPEQHSALYRSAPVGGFSRPEDIKRQMQNDLRPRHEVERAYGRKM